jgi:hypothetical protein
MHEATEAAHSGKSAEAISGRATGVLFFAGFGSLWLYNGISAMHRLNPISVTSIGVIFAALSIPAMLLRSASKAAHTLDTDSQESREVKRTFTRVNMVQWLAITAAIVLFNAIHKQEFLTPAITFIVGAHLVPLARLFSHSTHYVTGGLLMFWATVIAIAFPPEIMPSVGALGTAVLLLVSAAYTLTLAGRAAKSRLSSYRLHIAGV